MYIINKLNSFFYYFFIYPFYKILFFKIGKKTRIVNPLKIEGYSNIVLGDNVLIQYKSWLACLPQTNNLKPCLRIGSGSRIGNFNHIYSTSGIYIGENVLTADKVYISDCTHSYSDINLPILKQPIKQLREIKIGNGVWIGENVCVIGSSIGNGSVIGANSVVLQDIPDFCVAVGQPAKIIKKFNFETNEWEKYI